MGLNLYNFQLSYLCVNNYYLDEAFLCCVKADRLKRINNCFCSISSLFLNISHCLHRTKVTKRISCRVVNKLKLILDFFSCVILTHFRYNGFFLFCFHHLVLDYIIDQMPFTHRIEIYLPRV